MSFQQLCESSPYNFISSSNIKLIASLSLSLQSALASTLSIQSSYSVFTGNEEKCYLWYLLTYVESCQSCLPEPRAYPSNFSLSIASLDLESTSTSTSSSLSFKRRLPLFFKRFLLHLPDKLFHIHKLRKFNLFHYSSHLSGSSKVCRNFTYLFASHLSDRHSPRLRSIFLNNLLSYGLSPIIAHSIVNSFPLSHLEHYFYFSSHYLHKTCHVSSYFASIYGILEDPLLSYLARNSSVSLYYVAHGGGYGLHPNLLLHYIESTGCSELILWCFGRFPIRQTRFPKKIIKHKVPIIAFVLSVGANPQCISYFTRLSHQINYMLRNSGFTSKVFLHPNSLHINEFIHLDVGVSHKLHSSYSLVVYDNIGHTLMWDRIENNLAFLIVDYDHPIDYDLLDKDVMNFVKFLSGLKILLGSDQVLGEILYLIHSMIELEPFPERYVRLNAWYQSFPDLFELASSLA
ncbi:hypothetical protein SynBIOSU31_00267 [Synechococcus sp. BIOS-U3-1]|uniref:hypothetical protein n=1 Tax=Synechococcus sp. BIOS-U3-1 TaxID=1400865 RepID=UPI00164830BE|nr:hypothetical protein [Synechococcus sp. BIOS-U3-1]QNI57181.1 hypothetical protein SynBIOSU31_00267 [Synechococcus sp. BIOS-U3-1]